MALITTSARLRRSRISSKGTASAPRHSARASAEARVLLVTQSDPISLASSARR